MPRYHNHHQFKNQKVLGLKFQKKIQWVPHSSYPRPDLQAFRGGACVGISCYITKGLLTVTEYQLCLRQRAIDTTSSVIAYDVILFSFNLLPSHFLLKARSHKPP
jgi:hypothetical protein